jgi:hypothetical protein
MIMTSLFKKWYLISRQLLYLWMEITFPCVWVCHQKFLSVLSFLMTPQWLTSLFRLRISRLLVLIDFIDFSPLIVALVIKAIWILTIRHPVRSFWLLISLIILRIYLLTQSIKFIFQELRTLFILNLIAKFDSIKVLLYRLFVVFHHQRVSLI